MIVDFNREAFSRQYHFAATVAPQRSPIPAFQSIKLIAQANRIEIIAMDADMSVKLLVSDVTVKQPGEAVVPVMLMSKILRESNDDRLSLNNQDGKVMIKGRSSKFQLLSTNPDDYPPFDGMADGDYYEVSAKTFKEMIRRTSFATEEESGRYQLAGILLEFGEDTITAVGTDGRRLAKMEAEAKKVGKPENHGTTIVPKKSMSLIERMLADGEETIKIVSKPNDLLIGNDSGTFKTKLVEGRYPRWREVIPNRQGSTKIELPVGPFYSAVRQAAIVTSEESRGIDFEFGNRTLVLTTQTADIGDARVEMEVPYEGEKINITLDNIFMTDFLRVLAPESLVTMDIEGPEHAAYYSTADKYGYVIMPVQKNR